MDVRFSVYQEGPFWVAQGVDIDLCVSADASEDLPSKCEVLMWCEDQLPGGLGRIGPPPSDIASLWEKHGGISVAYPAIRKR